MHRYLFKGNKITCDLFYVPYLKSGRVGVCLHPCYQASAILKKYKTMFPFGGPFGCSTSTNTLTDLAFTCELVHTVIPPTEMWYIMFYNCSCCLCLNVLFILFCLLFMISMNILLNVNVLFNSVGFVESNFMEFYYSTFCQ